MTDSPKKQQASSLDTPLGDLDAPVIPHEENRALGVMNGYHDGRFTIWMLFERTPEGKISIRGSFTRERYANEWKDGLTKNARELWDKETSRSRFFVEKTQTNHLYAGRTL